AHLNGAEIVASECRRRSLRRPVEDAAAGDRLGAVAQTLDVERLPDLADEVRGVIRRGSVDTESDVDSGVLEFDGAGDSRGQPHVRSRAVGDGDPGGAEAADLRIVEVHTVRQPGPLPQPADGFEVVDGA